MALTNNLLVAYGAESVYGAEIPLTATGIVMKVNQIMIAILLGIATGATKTEASTKNGYMKVNGSEVKVYELPSDVIKGAIATDAEVEEMLAEVIPTV